MENEDAVHMAQPLRRRGAEFASRRSGRTDLFEVYLATGLQLTSGLSREGPEGEAATDENRAATEMPSDLVQRHFRSHLPAACYAGVLGISASHLNRIVKGTTDHGMHELIARKVIDESRREWSLP
jgi:AraC family transcriptional activator of pobA